MNRKLRGECWGASRYTVKYMRAGSNVIGMEELRTDRSMGFRIISEEKYAQNKGRKLVELIYKNASQR